MFEHPQPLSRLQPADTAGSMKHGTLPVGRFDAGPHHAFDQDLGGGALRALEWRELTARLNAARDLRILLQHDAKLNIEGNAASFGDAAASYFSAITVTGASDRGSCVNHDASEGHKASRRMKSGHVQPVRQGDGATGNAREQK